MCQAFDLWTKIYEVERTQVTNRNKIYKMRKIDGWLNETDKGDVHRIKVKDDKAKMKTI